jgi:outer membrane protein assembly factor BamD
MMQRSIPGSVQRRSLASDLRSGLMAGFTAAALITATLSAHGQSSTIVPDTSAQPAATDSTTPPSTAPNATLTNTPKEAGKQIEKDNSLAGIEAKLPDKELYDKAEDAVKRGHYDVARLDLQTLLNTYPDSEYMMRAKLAIADSWYKEGGTAELTQAEQEYKDFITFFPNSPEAAEAQMRVGDIYFRQMDKPDRDYTNTTQAEEAYRLMLQQFPESTLVPQAQQRLREVQETLASREADIASFYATRQNWSAVIARYQTVADTYPLYSHMDDVLVGLGDAFEAEADGYRTTKLPVPEAVKAHMEQLFDDQAAAAYNKVVLEHSAAPHVEDARDRLAAMGRPIPTPTADQVAASVALENSRGQYTLSKRATLLFLHQADTVPAATMGDPSLADAKPTLAPMVLKQTFQEANAALIQAANGAQAPVLPPATAPTEAADAGAAGVAPTAATAPPQLQDVTPASSAAGSTAVIAAAPASAPAVSSGGTTLGVEIVQPSSASPAPPATPPATPPAFPGSPVAAPTGDPNGGVKPVGPSNTEALAPIEKPATAPDQINEVTPGSQTAAQAAPADGKKKPKPVLDKAEESSSKKKPKKGLDKLNPF